MHLIECIISATKKSIAFSNCITKPVIMSGWYIDMSIACVNLYFGMVYGYSVVNTGQVARIMRFTVHFIHIF